VTGYQTNIVKCSDRTAIVVTRESDGNWLAVKYNDDEAEMWRDILARFEQSDRLFNNSPPAPSAVPQSVSETHR
jgi:hypothetical protein